VELVPRDVMVLVVVVATFVMVYASQAGTVLKERVRLTAVDLAMQDASVQLKPFALRLTVMGSAARVTSVWPKLFAQRLSAMERATQVASELVVAPLPIVMVRALLVDMVMVLVVARTPAVMVRVSLADTVVEQVLRCRSATGCANRGDMPLLVPYSALRAAPVLLIWITTRPRRVMLATTARSQERMQ
jgi:hypothetical protein